MNNKPLGFSLSVILFLCIHAGLKAQQPAQSGGGFKLFFEKVYLHIDRTYYAAGDDIWFKAYLVNAQNNHPFNTSNNLYVELINPTANIISRKVIRIDSVGIGDFLLPDSLAAGTYRVRAYTNWMKNFGSRFVFERQIYIANTSSATNNINNSKASQGAKKVVSPSYTIQFFPEGGLLIQGVPTLVSFKAEDANGKGVNARGSVISDKGETVAKFETSYLGMGSFNFTPKAGTTYKALVQYKNDDPVEAVFRAAIPEGFVMNISPANPAAIAVNISANLAAARLHPTGVMTVVARHAGKSYYRQQIVLKEGSAALSIPTDSFPPGIAYITLYDEEMHPHSERLVYIQNREPLKVSVSVAKNSYKPKEQTTVDLLVTDYQNKPVKTALSMAVVDASVDSLPSGSILSHLMLESELEGKIENPSSYFDVNNPNRFEQLDLLLRTQGWRSFLWRYIADTSLHIRYLPEAGISITGNVTKPASKKPLENMNITLFAPGAKGDKIYMTKTNADGKYYLDGLPLYGMQSVKLNVGDAIGKTVGAIKVDADDASQLPVTINPLQFADTADFVKSFIKEAQKRASKFKNNQWYNLLPNVTVTARQGTTILRDGSAVVNFGYPEYDFNISEKDYQYQRLRDFLVQKVPGALYDEELEGVNFLSNGKRVRPILVVNKQQDVFDRLDYYSLSMEQIESVHVRHMVGSKPYTDVNNPTGDEEVAMTVPRGINDYFLITLKIKPGNYDQQLSKLNVDVTGYYEGRMFYSPNYSKDDTAREDSRITIHWEPYLKTDANGKATVRFYNADPKSKIRIDLQGLTVDGVPVVGQASYQVN